MMDDNLKTKEQLISELNLLRKRVEELERNDILSNFAENFTRLGSDTQKLLDALPFYAMLIDSDHKVLVANNAVRSKLNLLHDDIYGENCFNLIHDKESPIKNCPLNNAVMKGRAVEREYFDKKLKSWFTSGVYPCGFNTKEGKPVYFHLFHDITKHKEAERELKKSYDKLKIITQKGIQAISAIVEKRDPYTAGHQQRVSELAYNIAKEMKLPEEKAEGVRMAGLLHDIGKVAVPIEILSKPGKLSIHELNIIRMHPEAGYDILKDIEFPWPVAEVVRQHHERLDGKGYPQGLTTEKLSLEAKILGVADVVEAMYSHRPYRPAPGIDKALEEISRNKGILYDADVVDGCLKIFSNDFTFKTE